MKFSMIPSNILHHHLPVLPVIIIVIVVHLITTTSAYSPGQGKKAPRGSTSSSRVETLAMEDFQHLTDKLTHKIMADIERLKKEDPNFGMQGQHKPEEEDMTDEQMKMVSKCEFHCPDGLVQEENPSFKMPSFKNCNQYDDSWDRIPGASGCCVRHEICYHTCTRDRTQCDMEFRMCIENVCDELQEKGMIRSAKVIESCQSAMGMLGIMIMEPGCKMYPKAQGAACICVEEEPDDDDGRLEDVTFFDKHIDQERQRRKIDDVVTSCDDDECVGNKERAVTGDDHDDDQGKGRNDDGAKHDDHDEL